MEMRAHTVFVAATDYLERWAADEARIHAKLQSEIPAQLRQGLGEAANHFKVARNLRRESEHALGMPRYEFLRRAFASVPSTTPREDQLADVVVRLGREIAKYYGGTLFLSAASKLLWARYRDPFIIYDSRVRTALGTPERDYHTYVDAWRVRYREQAALIRHACDSLGSSPFTLCSGRILSVPEVREIVEQEWYQRRVFDNLIWRGGA